MCTLTAARWCHPTLMHAPCPPAMWAALQTMPYMPPELLEQSQLTPAADTYSFGMIMWESFTGQARPRQAAKHFGLKFWVNAPCWCWPVHARCFGKP